MSRRVIIKNVRRNCCERRVDVDSEEELKNMTVKQFKRRFCPDDEYDQTRGDCDRKHESVHEPGCSGDISNRSTGQGSESVDFAHDRPGSATERSVFQIPCCLTEFLKDDQTLGHYGIREGSTIHRMELLRIDRAWGSAMAGAGSEDEDEHLVGIRRPPLPEDEDKIIPRSRSMDNLLFDMQQPR